MRMCCGDFRGRILATDGDVGIRRGGKRPQRHPFRPADRLGLLHVRRTQIFIPSGTIGNRTANTVRRLPPCGRRTDIEHRVRGHRDFLRVTEQNANHATRFVMIACCCRRRGGARRGDRARRCRFLARRRVVGTPRHGDGEQRGKRHPAQFHSRTSRRAHSPGEWFGSARALSMTTSTGKILATRRETGNCAAIVRIRLSIALFRDSCRRARGRFRDGIAPDAAGSA